MLCANSQINETHEIFYDGYVSQDELLYPQSENILCCKIDFLGDPSGEDIVFTPFNDKLENKGLLGANVLARNVNNRICIQLMNSTSDTVTVKKHTKIGMVENTQCNKEPNICIMQQEEPHNRQRVHAIIKKSQ